MKFLGLLVLLFSVNSFALKQMEDTQVSAQLIESHTHVASKDRNVSASLVSVYRGSAAGLTSIIVNIFDQGPSEGDFPNVSTYEFSNFSDEPKNISITKLKSKQYLLSFTASEVSSDEETGDFKYTPKKISLKIELNNNKTVTNVTRVSK